MPPWNEKKQEKEDEALRLAQRQWKAKLKALGRKKMPQAVRLAHFKKRVPSLRDVTGPNVVTQRLGGLEPRTRKRRTVKKTKARAASCKQVAFKSDVEVALWLIAYLLIRLAALHGTVINVVKTGFSDLNALLRAKTPELSLTPAACKVKNVAETVTAAVGQQFARAKVLSLLQVHKPYDTVLTIAAKIRCKVNLATWTFIYILFWRTRSPIVLQWADDNTAQLNRKTLRAMQNHFVDTFDVPDLALSNEITSECKTAQMARKRSIKYSNRLLVSFTDVEAPVFDAVKVVLGKCGDAEKMRGAARRSAYVQAILDMEAAIGQMPLTGPYTTKNGTNGVDQLAVPYKQWFGASDCCKVVAVRMGDCLSGSNGRLLLVIGIFLPECRIPPPPRLLIQAWVPFCLFFKFCLGFPSDGK